MNKKSFNLIVVVPLIRFYCDINQIQLEKEKLTIRRYHTGELENLINLFPDCRLQLKSAIGTSKFMIENKIEISAESAESWQYYSVWQENAKDIKKFLTLRS